MQSRKTIESLQRIYDVSALNGLDFNLYFALEENRLNSVEKRDISVYVQVIPRRILDGD